MDKNTFAFLKAALGPDGASAMRRAVAKNPDLTNYLVPRTLLGWLTTKSEYEGVLPGCPHIYLQFNKAEAGYSMKLGKNSSPVTSLAVPSQYHMVAELIEALGFDMQKISATDSALNQLGKSVDILLKAQAALKALKKGAVDLPGTTHKPTEPKGPAEPELPRKQPPMAAKPKLPKTPVLKVEKSKLGKSCASCESQLFKNQKFVGCVCTRDLAKHSTTTIYGDGIVIEFSKSADARAVLDLQNELNNG